MRAVRWRAVAGGAVADGAVAGGAVRWRAVANTLSTGLEVRRWSRCSAGTSKNVSRAPVSLVRQATAGLYLTPYFSVKTSVAAKATAFVSA